MANGDIPGWSIYEAPTTPSSLSTSSGSSGSGSGTTESDKKTGYYTIWVGMLLLGWFTVLSFVLMKVARGRVFLHRNVSSLLAAIASVCCCRRDHNPLRSAAGEYVIPLMEFPQQKVQVCVYMCVYVSVCSLLSSI